MLLAAAVVSTGGGPACAQNSTKKVRKAPGELASKAGTAVPWRDDVDAALAESRKTGRPVFWYVPEVRRSKMDRKPEIDRYMMGGPFSWPSTIALLQEHFVPVRAAAGGELAKQLEVVPGRFIEPGYVVLDANGKALLKVDQITTFHPQWFEAPLRRVVNKPLEGFPCHPVLKDAWAAYADRDYVRAQLLAHEAFEGGCDEHGERLGHEVLWLVGAAKYRLGEQSEALESWRDLAGQKAWVEEYGHLPFVYKAALELEGHGPFVHAFEVYGDVPRSTFAADPTDGTRAPEGTFTEQQLWQRGVAFLLAAHDGDHVYRDSTYDFGGTDSLPNVHAAVTCLVGEALLAALDRMPADARKGASKGAHQAVLEHLTAMRENAMKDEWLELADRDEILWARAYALRFLQAWKARRGRDGDDEKLDEGIRRGVGALLALQPETGVWFHEYGNPFAIATALQALHTSRSLGVVVPKENIERGLRALAFNRTKDGAFTYSQTREGREPRANTTSAACRMPLCELGLFLFGHSDQQRLLAAIDMGLEHHDKLAAVRKYDDHADRYGHGGFFFWFDMLGRAEAIAELTDDATRRDRAAAQKALILALPEFDGCFVDSHELGRCYGTAMALLCLDALDRALR